MNRLSLSVLGTIVVGFGALYAQGRPADVRFAIHMVDPGASGTTAFADLNSDHRLDIVSSDSWYEAPAWTKHKIRDIAWNGRYVDNFSDLPIDVDGDGHVDVVQFGYFSNNIVWVKNPGRAGGAWKVTEIYSGFPTEFAQLVDLDNDGKARELFPEFDRPAAPLMWFDLQGGTWIKHVVSDHELRPRHRRRRRQRRGRNDILTPRGWFEAPADVRNAAWGVRRNRLAAASRDRGERHSAAAAIRRPGGLQARSLARHRLRRRRRRTSASCM